MDGINGLWIIKVGLKCPYNDDYESAVWCGGAIHTGIAHGAVHCGVNGPQAAHTWEPAGSKSGSPIGPEQGNPALWLAETRLCHSHHPRVHSAHTPPGHTAWLQNQFDIPSNSKEPWWWCSLWWTILDLMLSLSSMSSRASVPSASSLWLWLWLWWSSPSPSWPPQWCWKL